MEEIIAAVTSEIVVLLEHLEQCRRNSPEEQDRIKDIQITIEALRDIRFRLEELI